MCKTTIDAACVIQNRREILQAGATLVAALSHGLASAQNRSSENQNYPAQAYGATSAKGPIGPMPITRRPLGPNDVLLDVLYCGICHSDIHAVHADWGTTRYPIVPGHEIVGRVVAVGSKVTKFRAGDVGGVGCMVNSCGACENCLADREQNCMNGTTFTYGSEDRVSGGQTFGGYSTKMVVTEKFVIRIPPGVDLAATAPLLCAGITTFSPMQHWRVAAGQRVGVVGLGGLGHMAVKLGTARKAEVTAFTTSPGKLQDAKRLGAREAVLWSDTQAMRRFANRFDLIISTVPVSYPMQPFIELLKLDATLVNVGALGQTLGVSGMAQGFGRKSLAGSMIGGIAETQQVIDYCAGRKIKADVELIQPEQIEQAYQRVLSKDVRYRFVIDFTAPSRRG